MIAVCMILGFAIVANPVIETTSTNNVGNLVLGGLQEMKSENANSALQTTMHHLVQTCNGKNSLFCSLISKIKVYDTILNATVQVVSGKLYTFKFQTNIGDVEMEVWLQPASLKYFVCKFVLQGQDYITDHFEIDSMHEYF